jgi:ferredoxin
MIQITVDGYGTVEAREGERLVLALERGGVDILHRCGGVARCTTCRVQFSAGEPEALTQAEKDKLTEKGMQIGGPDGVRLSCQIECHHDMSLKPVQTVQNSGLEAGKAPAEGMEPEAVWV